ncbi:MAG: hypothetical protein AABW87_00200 [Nanoarchaeota archaeon]
MTTKEAVKFPDVLGRMSTRHMIFAVLKANPSGRSFNDYALLAALEEGIRDHPKLRRLLIPRCDGSSPDHPNSLETALSFIGMSYIFLTDSSLQYEKLTDFGIDHINKELRRYGPGLMRKLKPFTDAIWEAYRRYK